MDANAKPAAVVKPETKEGNGPKAAEPLVFKAEKNASNSGPSDHNRRGGRGGNRGGNYRGGFRRGGGGPRGGGPAGGSDFRSNQHNNQNQPADLMAVDVPQNFNRRDGGPGGPSRRAPYSNRQPEDRIAERLLQVSRPTTEIPAIVVQEREFNNRCRLYVGNLVDTNEEEIKEMFSKYGKVGECFVNTEKMFAFVRMDLRENAEKARNELDGQMRKNRTLKVRYAPSNYAIKVRNLNSQVTNELLEWGFQIFGEVERAVVIADDRGKSTGEGIVEYSKKHSLTQAIQYCTEKCYFLSASIRPVIVEPYEPTDETEGYPEKNIYKKNDFFQERSVGPRFADPGSFEEEYGNRWKELYDEHRKKDEALKRVLKLDEDKLMAQMEYARYEHETEKLRAELLAREQNKDRQKRECEIREQQAEDFRRREEELLRQKEEDSKKNYMLKRKMQEEHEMMQQQQQQQRHDNNSDIMNQMRTIRTLDTLQILMNQGQSQNFRGNGGPGSLMQQEGKGLVGAYDGRGPRGNNSNSRWSRDRPDDFAQSKRRRY